VSSSRATVGRRLRAALQYADQTAAGLAAEVGDLNIGLRTIERIMQGRRAPRRWELERFAEVLGVPEWFLADGFEGARLSRQEDELAAELQRLRAVNDALEDELERVRQEGARRGRQR
jgi:transcriptional regulator with XRE-family HTH domain